MSDSQAVDLDRLGKWMDSHGLPPGPITDVEALAGGTQNVLLRFTRAGRPYVFRRGPWHLRRRSNDAIRREMRVLAALAGSDVPHPGFIAGCGDETVLDGAAFYLMEEVDGFNASVALPPLHAGDEKVRHAMGLAVVDALAALGAVDHEAAGLGDVGHPEGFLERQVPRWLSELESYSGLAGYPGPDLPGLDEMAAWLDEHRPPSFRPGISHGDYHLGNVMFRHDGPELAAIIDWEMCTIGDPLLDLGWLLATWPPGMLGEPSPLEEAGGLPGPDELVSRYGSGSSRDLSSVAWYAVMACFKLGIVIEGTHARACAGLAEKDVGDRLHAAAHSLFERAHRWM